jgi:hypothetical protein
VLAPGRFRALRAIHASSDPDPAVRSEWMEEAA